VVTPAPVPPPSRNSSKKIASGEDHWCGCGFFLALAAGATLSNAAAEAGVAALSGAASELQAASYDVVMVDDPMPEGEAVIPGRAGELEAAAATFAQLQVLHARDELQCVIRRAV